MISIIVSSYQEVFFQPFAQSISDTIGVPYEVIRIDNPGLMGICEAYNKGAAQAKYDILCFCHEDILFQVAGWGKLIADVLHTEKNAGMIGVAGSTIKTSLPTGWTCCMEKGYDYMDAVAHNHDGNGSNGSGKSLSAEVIDVKVIDGLFMCCRKEVWVGSPGTELEFAL